MKEKKSLMDVCKEIIDYHKSKQSPAISDIKALKKWTKVPPNIKQLLMKNQIQKGDEKIWLLQYKIVMKH